MPSLPARPTHWRLLASAAWLACAAGQAHGAAYQLGTGDPDWLANAFAGTAAKAYDAGSAWNNPAGMTLIQGNEIDSGLNYFDPGIRFSGEDVVNGVAVRGYQGGDAAPSAVTAGSETVISLSRDLKLGVAVEAPFGLRTSYPSSFVGRYQSLVSAIEDLQFAPSLAYQVTPQLSVGGGPAVSYFRARLSQAIDTTIYDRTAGDPTLDIRGDDIKVGYNIGALYQFTPSLRLGVDYHSRIGQNVVGKQQATVPTSLTKQVPVVAAVVDALNQERLLRRHAGMGRDGDGAMDRLEFDQDADDQHPHLGRGDPDQLPQHMAGISGRQLPPGMVPEADAANRRTIR
jgi:long-chain fatty acid transport protein